MGAAAKHGFETAAGASNALDFCPRAVLYETLNNCAILIGICSCVSATARREAVRETWLRRLPPGVRAVFFVGAGNAAPNEDRVVQLPVEDDYASLPRKVATFFHFARAGYDFDYLFKCDDDTYVCAERLIELARKRARYVGGGEWLQERFASGGAGYLLSRKAVAILTAAPFPGLGAEDVWVGEVLREAGVKLCPTGRLRMDHKDLPSPENDLVSAHWCSPELMKLIDAGFTRPGKTNVVASSWE